MQRNKSRKDDESWTLFSQCVGAVRHARQRVGVVSGLVRGLSFEFRGRSPGTLYRLVPCQTGRQLELRCRVLPVGASGQQLARLPGQLPRVPAGPLPRSVGQRAGKQASKQTRRTEASAPTRNEARDERKLRRYHNHLRIQNGSNI